MTQIGTENLFLLEFLVDDVNLDKKCECDSPPGQLCVSFRFLDNGPLEVCEADFSPANKYGSNDDNTKSGKSCLFSLSPQLIEGCLTVFDLLVTVKKLMPPDVLPDNVDLGLACISLAQLFAELVGSIEATETGGPVAKTMKDVFSLQNQMGKEIGKIGIYIRMSCFGKLIVTQFQMNLQDKSVLFKDKEGKSLYRYRKVGKSSKFIQIFLNN